MQVCDAVGCESTKVVSRGLCRHHYDKFYQAGILPPKKKIVKPKIEIKQKKGDKCKLDNCDIVVHSKGYCLKHYLSYIRYGEEYVKAFNMDHGEKKSKCITALKVLYLFGHRNKETEINELLASQGFISGDFITKKGKKFLLLNTPKICAVPQCNRKTHSVILCANHHANYARGFRGEELFESVIPKPSDGLLQLLEFIMRNCNEKGYPTTHCHEKVIDLILDGLESDFLRYVDDDENSVTITHRSFNLYELDVRPELNA